MHSFLGVGRAEGEGKESQADSVMNMEPYAGLNVRILEITT